MTHSPALRSPPFPSWRRSAVSTLALLTSCAAPPAAPDLPPARTFTAIEGRVEGWTGGEGRVTLRAFTAWSGGVGGPPPPVEVAAAPLASDGRFRLALPEEISPHTSMGPITNAFVGFDSNPLCQIDARLSAPSAQIASNVFLQVEAAGVVDGLTPVGSVGAPPFPNNVTAFHLYYADRPVALTSTVTCRPTWEENPVQEFVYRQSLRLGRGWNMVKFEEKTEGQRFLQSKSSAEGPFDRWILYRQVR